MIRFNFRRLKKPYARLISALLVVLIVALLVSQTSLLQRPISSLKTAYTLATTHQPERFSELYFDNHRTLTYTATTAAVQVNEFHISNFEAKTYTYNYLVTSLYNNVTLVLDKGTTTLKNGQGVDIPFSFIVASPTSKVLISVSLTGLPNHIFYWISP